MTTKMKSRIKKAKEIQPMNLVVMEPNAKEWYMKNLHGKELHNWMDKFAGDKIFVYLGEIKNMPGHGVFINHITGEVLSGYHLDAFMLYEEE